MIQSHIAASQVTLVVKNPPANAGDMRHVFDPWVRKIPWRRKWNPTLVFLLEEPHGKRSLVDYSTWGPKESDITLGHIKGACKFFLKGLHHEYLGLWAI